MDTMILEPARVKTTATAPFAPSTSQPPRMELYTTIHKALRQFMNDTLVRIGAMDIDDADETHETLEQFGSLLATLRAHVAHENTFVHAAIESRRPGAVRRVQDDHEEHLATIEELEAQGQALRAAAGPERDAAALRLYRHLALFIAENLEHMHVEETSNQALLWALFSDTELVALHDNLVASIPLPEMAVAWRWMAGSLNFKELAGMLCAMQAGMPPAAFQGVLELMQAQMSSRRWTRLAAQLGVQRLPGQSTRG